MIPRRLLPGRGASAARRLVAYGGTDRFPLAEDVEALALADLCAELSALDAAEPGK